MIWSDKVLKEINTKSSVLDQLDMASTSIVLNIAEGNSKYSSKDRCRYFDISRGSTLECSSCLDVLVRKNLLKDAESLIGKNILKEIVSMLVGLIKSNSDRVFEPIEEYDVKEQAED